MIDNIYILNYVIEREIAKGSKIVVTFVELKATFDSVDRRVLGRSLEGIVPPDITAADRLDKNMNETKNDMFILFFLVELCEPTHGRLFLVCMRTRGHGPLSTILFHSLINRM